jgi:hypothetical protein
LSTGHEADAFIIPAPDGYGILMSDGIFVVVFFIIIMTYPARFFIQNATNVLGYSFPICGEVAMMMPVSRRASGGRAGAAAKPKWMPAPAMLGRRAPVTPLAVKVVLVVVMLNLLVAAMMLMKLRAPHLG